MGTLNARRRSSGFPQKGKSWISFLTGILRAVVILAFIIPLFVVPRSSQAADGSAPAAARRKTITVAYQKYIWWVLRWSGNTLLCTVTTDHENLPSGAEIYAACGKSVYTEWFNTPGCSLDANSDISSCQGVYLHLLTKEAAEKSVLVDLPEAKAWLSLGICGSSSPSGFCTRPPTILITGEEPLYGEQITAVHAIWNGKTFSCPGSTCEVPLSSTPMRGSSMEFWAESSFGDTSLHYTALIRMVDSGLSNTAANAGWYVDVISSQWQGKAAASCSQIWNAFPPIGDLPDWLTTPEAPALLASEEPYLYLAGRLIAQGVVDATACPGGGLLANGYADACGMEKARPKVQEWQNGFDQQILKAATNTGIPGQVLKNIFAQESQFWPGAFKDPYEFGLGQLTDNGAETLLLWNPSFYNQYCPLVLDITKCERGYVYLSAESQALLRGALAVQAKSDCAGCPGGVDIGSANFSITLFAQTILANCTQVARIVYNASGKSPGAVSDYENLWRLTAANYHIGPGCLSYAVYTAWNQHELMDWEHISTHLTTPCTSAISYVEKVSK